MEVTLHHVPGAITRVPGPSVALTFDDGPDPRSTGRLMSVLDQFGVVATFFVLGRQLERHPELGQQLAAAGHELGNHSYNHINLARASTREIDRELLDCQRVITGITGRAPRLFRPPYGAVTSRVTARARLHGLTTALWSVDTRDWSRPGIRAITARALTAGPGDIILFHDLPSSVAGTAKALLTVIRDLVARGLTLTTLGQAGVASPTGG